MEGVSGGGCQPGCGPADQSLGRDPNGLAGTLRLARTSGSVPSWAVDGCPSWRDLPRAGRRRAAPQDKPPSTPPHGKPGSSPRVLGVGLQGRRGADLDFRFREGWAGGGWSKSAAGLTWDGQQAGPDRV